MCNIRWYHRVPQLDFLKTGTLPFIPINTVESRILITENTKN